MKARKGFWIILLLASVLFCAVVAGGCAPQPLFQGTPKWECTVQGEAGRECTPMERFMRAQRTCMLAYDFPSREFDRCMMGHGYRPPAK